MYLVLDKIFVPHFCSVDMPNLCSKSNVLSFDVLITVNDKTDICVVYDTVYFRIFVQEFRRNQLVTFYLNDEMRCFCQTLVFT